MLAWSSLALDIEGSAAGEMASFFITSSAATAGGPSAAFSGLARIWPPAEPRSELNQTVSPSYCAACTSIFPLAPSFWPWASISAHVLGGFGTKSLR